MTQPRMPRMPQWQLDLMVATYTLGIDHAVANDVSALLKFLATASPDLPELAVAEARLLLHFKDFVNARALLEKTEAAHPRHAVVKAVLACCMFMQGDPMWESTAQATLALPHDDSVKNMVEVLSRASGKTVLAAPADDIRAALMDPATAFGMLC